MFESYDIKTDVIEIAGNTYTIQRIGDIDMLFDTFIKKATAQEVNDERIPYWAELWPCALATAQFIHEHEYYFRCKSIIEIGAGLGLPSIVASTMAKHIDCTDYIEEAVAFAKQNYLLNYNNTELISFYTYDWRDIKSISKCYDIVIASDVAYERKMISDLDLCFNRLSNNNSKIILAEPRRDMAKEYLKQLEVTNRIEHRKTYTIELRGSKTLVDIYVLVIT